MSDLKSVSLFTGAGIGDIGFRAAGMRCVVMAELEPDRAALAQLNFPSAEMVIGDIWDMSAKIVDLATSDGEEVFLVSCTAPCQGMSKNGKGKLLRNVRDGKRPSLDQRNRLILPALETIKAIRPRWVFFENVSEMANTLIEDESGELLPILDVIQRGLGPEYVGRAYDLEFADYGVPQRRRRLITVYTRSPAGVAYLEKGGEFVPSPTHSASADEGKAAWVTVAEALTDFSALDAGHPDDAYDPDTPFHRVPVLDELKYSWLSHPPTGRSAFDNQCAACGFDGNTTHGASHDADGINRAHTSTPILCERCGALLPRPFVLDGDQPRIMRGYTSAYKRMSPDLPAPALTRNLSYACSDQKVHPFENRVLSLAEAFRIHTLDEYQFKWGPVRDHRGGRRDVAPDSTIRLVLGESIPPRINELVAAHIVAVEQDEGPDPVGQSTLFSI